MVGNKNILLGKLDSNIKTKLSARLSADCFVYSVFDESNNIVYAVKYTDGYDFDLIYSDIIEINPSEIKFVFTTAPFFHSPFKNDELLDFMPSFHGKSVFKNKVSKYDVNTTFGVNKPYYDFVDRFQNKENIHISDILMDIRLEEGATPLVAFFDRDVLHLSYTTNDSFKFYNQYECKTKDDYLYWISAVYTVLELNKNKVPLAVLGDLSESSELFEHIINFIPNPVIVKHEFGLDNFKRTKFESQNFIDLYQALLCE